MCHGEKKTVKMDLNNEKKNKIIKEFITQFSGNAKPIIVFKTLLNKNNVNLPHYVNHNINKLKEKNYIKLIL